MTPDIVIIGAGPAGVGAALAALEDARARVTVIDIGVTLESENERVRQRLANLAPEDWDPGDVRTIGAQPVATGVRGLPQKRSFGSDFPFRDAGQLQGIDARANTNDAVVSGAYGGFSNVWGAQVMPFSPATFRDWPFDFGHIKPHYAAILREIPFAAEVDDLSAAFPLLADAAPLPPLSERSAMTLDRYARHRSSLRRRGVTVGRARLALRAPDCVLCGMCLTGCPYHLIYSAAHTLDRLRATGRVSYISGFIATRVEEDAHGAIVHAREVGSGRPKQLRADMVFVACGTIGTSRLVMGSLDLVGIPVPVAESAQFTLPFLSRVPTHDPRHQRDFTLNQFNMILETNDDGRDISQLHFYTYSDAFLSALPGVFDTRVGRRVQPGFLRRLSVALGYLPSWASPRFTIRATRSASPNLLPDLTIDAVTHAAFARNRMLRGTLRRIVSSAPHLDLWPVLSSLSFAAPGKSYHWGGTFPHASVPGTAFSSDVLGRVGPWRRIHLVDASVFPTVAATTFTLTVMANAHRIAAGALRGAR